MLTQYALFRKTWRSLICELTPELQGLFNYYIEEGGVISVCKAFDAAAFDLITGKIRSERTADIAVALSKYTLAEQLQVLRFGKRYTPEEVGEEQLQTEVQAFLQQNRKVKFYDRGYRSVSLYSEDDPRYGDQVKGLPYWLEKKLSFCADQIWPKKPRFHAFNCWHDMPTGVTAEGFKNHFEKLLAYDFSIDREFAYKFPVTSVDYATSSKLIGVPKNYKGPRLICEEPLLSQCAMRKGESILRDVLACKPDRLLKRQSKYNFFPFGKIQLTDQGRNQSLCALAARTRKLATIDLSRASDSLTYTVANAIIPKAWVNDVLGDLSTSVTLPTGKVRSLYICGTMGACVTFPLETLVFWTIVCAAGHTCINYGVGSFEWFDNCAVYGDDIIVPCEWYDTVVDFLNLCGFTVNSEKSYTGDIPYRESCGVEYYDTEEVSSIYWPRRIIRGTIDDIPSLIALTNRLFSIGAEKSASYVAQYADSLVAGIPRVRPNSQEVGIWSYSISRRLRRATKYLIAKVILEYKFKMPQFARILVPLPLDDPFYETDENKLVVTYDTRLFSNPTRFDKFTTANGGYIYNMYRYYRFLACGPEYNSELDRVLHVSTPRGDIGREVPTGYRVSSTPYIIYDVIRQYKEDGGNDLS